MKILVLNEAEATQVATALTAAVRDGRKVRVAWDDGFKIKVGEGMWSPPMGELPKF